MESLWGVIFVIFVLLRLFNKMPELKEKLPKDWGDKKLPPIFEEMGFPWDEDETVEPQPLEVAKKKAKTDKKIVETKGRKQGRPEKYAPADNRPSVFADNNDEDLNWFPELNQEAVVHGIIISELLRPPKALRHGK